MENVLAHRRHAALTEDERKILNAAISQTKTYPARSLVTPAFQETKISMLLMEGFMARHIDDKSGARQQVALQMPGDFVDLHAYALKALDHHVATITAATVGIVEHRKLDKILDEHPRLARKLWFSTLLDAALHRRWEFRLGKLNAKERLAHLFCESNFRLLAVKRSNGKAYKFPLTQLDLADICALTAIHVNRVLRELREERLCEFRDAVVTIHNLPKLAEMGQFDPAYLYPDPPLASRWKGLRGEGR